MKTTPLLCLCVAASAFAGPAVKYDQIPRLDFNTRAIEHHLPLFWRTDANNDKTLDPSELAVLWTDVATKRADWVDAKGAFTKKFTTAYTAMVAPTSCASKKGDEQKRCEAVVLELSQGRPTLVESDFSAGDQALVDHMQKAAWLIEKIYARQTGVDAYFAKLPKGDDLSHALFFRNQGRSAPRRRPRTTRPAARCRPSRSRGLYPADIQTDKAFCAALEKQPNGKALMDHFNVVTKGQGEGHLRHRPLPHRLQGRDGRDRQGARGGGEGARCERGGVQGLPHRGGDPRSAPTTGSPRTRPGSRWASTTRSTTCASRRTSLLRALRLEGGLRAAVRADQQRRPRLAEEARAGEGRDGEGAGHARRPRRTRRAT